MGLTGKQLRDKALAEVVQLGFEGRSLPPGYWCIGEDVWQAFQTEGLDAASYRGDLPCLFGRPLMRREEPESDHLHYEARMR